MIIDTVAYVPADADEADAIARMIKSLNGATIKLHLTGGIWLIVPIMRAWSVTEAWVSIYFSPGVIETLGRKLNALDLLKTAGKSVGQSHGEKHEIPQ